MTIVGTGEQLRDFTHVSDVVRANIAAMNKCAQHSGKLFNVGCGTNYSINQLAGFVGGETVTIPPREHDAKETLASIRDTIGCLDWEPTVSLQQGVEIVRKYYEELFSENAS
jgi:UDP-glucose 4-epimerase